MRYRALLLLALAATACSPGIDGERQVLVDTVDFAILPLHAEFVTASRSFDARVGDFCGVPDVGNLRLAQDAWRRAMEAWQRVQTVRFGPVTDDNQAWKVQFWPDPNNLVRSKVEGLIGGGEALTPERLESASVVAQGLSAAEYLLFDAEGGALERYANERDADAARRCGLLQLVAGHTVGVADFLQQGWLPGQGGYAVTFANPGDDNPAYPAVADAQAALLDSIFAAVEIAKDDKLGEPLGERNDLGIAKPYAVEAWRSRHSLALIEATLDGAHRLYYAGEPGGDGYGVDDLLRDRDGAALADAIDRQFAVVMATAPDGLTLFTAVEDAGSAETLGHWHESLSVLADLLKNEVPGILGVTLGFNERDGD